MKTAISIPDDLFQRADEFAKRLGKSRSQVYREALTDYLRRQEPASITMMLNCCVDEISPGLDPWTVEGARLALERSEW